MVFRDCYFSDKIYASSEKYTDKFDPKNPNNKAQSCLHQKAISQEN